MPHLVDHLNLSESETVQPVHLHHVALSMGLRQLNGDKERKGEKKRERAGGREKKKGLLKCINK